MMSSRWLPRLVVLAAFTLPKFCGAGQAPAETASMPDAPAQYQVQVFVENDLLHRTDRYYTNGIKLGFGVSVPGAIDATYRGLLNLLPGEEGALNFGVFAGQNMYTPKDITIAEPQPFDRPWAGWLYLGLVGQEISTGADSGKTRPDTLSTVEIDLGVVGPASGAGDLQAWRHRQIGSPRPVGWANQLPNEPAFLIAYLHKRRYGSRWGGVDFIPHFGATLGTVATLVRAGGVARIGYNATGFGPDLIEPGGATLQSTRKRLGKSNGGPYEGYLFAGADLRLVAYNIFLDGTVFNDSPSVDRRPFVYDLVAGASVRAHWLRISLTNVVRSEEFTTAMGGGGKQRFFSLNIGLEFEK